MSQIKGMEILSALRYLRGKFGTEGVHKILTSLPEIDREVLSSVIGAVKWYDLRYFTVLMDVADRLLGNGDFEIHYQMGKYCAAESFKGIYKVFIKIMSPEAIIKKASLFWKNTDSSGRLEIIEAVPGRCVGRIIDFDQPIKSYCRYGVGFFTQIIESAGGKNVQGKESQCRLSGAHYCEYIVTWE